MSSEAAKNGCAPKLIVLDIGLSATVPSMTSGSILEFSIDGKLQRTLVQSQALPDGLAADCASGRMFWTCMGKPGDQDGAIYSADLNGKDLKTVVPTGAINTPKQLTLDNVNKKVYFCDREGLRVYRCNYDGTDLEHVISTGNADDPEVMQDAENWGKGRIFCASILTPSGASPHSRPDVHCILTGLPEPIDLEIDEKSHILYWTDRGEIPFGNSLNRIQLNESGLRVGTLSKPEVLTRHLNEAIGLKLDGKNGHIYITDLGGNLYRCNMDGQNKTKLYSDDQRALTGLTLV
ncbi:hypothetical protein AARAC_002029 [Aspergillus arachidicola]|uniref:3-hydroxyacyl-CoA dehydrogenase n=1 Tax=Aspergillus arachidicola TaxID=656916 RepID=A0A2G7FVQ8_9EURO|nr:hypothetical protein AARAC_002029 [Aspergillus arachidicola]